MKSEQEIREELKDAEEEFKHWEAMYNSLTNVEMAWTMLNYWKVRISTLKWCLS